MRIEVDLGKCTGHGICESIAEDVFEVSDDGTVLRAPVEGSVPDKIDEKKAKAVPGVTSVIRLPHGVGVVADSDPASELAETRAKMQALLGALVRP